FNLQKRICGRSALDLAMSKTQISLWLRGAGHGGGISVEAAGDVADEDAEDEVDEDNEDGGRAGDFERHPGDVPLVDQGGDCSNDVERCAGLVAQNAALGAEADQH